MIKSERFVAGDLWIERTKHREGPPVVYTVKSGRKSQLFTDHKELLRFVKWPKSTPTGEKLREWLQQFDSVPAEKTVNPQAETKMVT